MAPARTPPRRAGGSPASSRSLPPPAFLDRAYAQPEFLERLLRDAVVSERVRALLKEGGFPPLTGTDAVCLPPDYICKHNLLGHFICDRKAYAALQAIIAMPDTQVHQLRMAYRRYLARIGSSGARGLGFTSTYGYGFFATVANNLNPRKQCKPAFWLANCKQVR